MRRIVPDQLHLVPTRIDHAHARELDRMSAVLDALPAALNGVYADLLRRAGRQVDARKGRDGMTAEQVLRALVVKQMNGFSYEELSFHLADSNTYRSFCRFGIDQTPPQKSTLQKNIKCVRAETWEAINRKLIQYAAAQGVERGEKTRTDCTVVESDIHEPTDSSLLRDCVRVLARQVSKAAEDFGLKFKNNSRRAKRRALAILNARSTEARLPLYRDLLKVTEKTVRSAVRIAGELDTLRAPDVGALVRAGALAGSLRHYVKLAERVIDQTQRRVLRGESVPAHEKLVSIFEPHTDIIVKDRRDTLYGHKLCLTTGPSGLVTDVVVERATPRIQRSRSRWSPDSASFSASTLASTLVVILLMSSFITDRSLQRELPEGLSRQTTVPVLASDPLGAHSDDAMATSIARRYLSRRPAQACTSRSVIITRWLERAQKRGSSDPS